GVGTPAAYLLATRRFRGRSLLVGVLELPLVLPPAVAGISLLAAFGANGLLGGTLDALGLRIPFTQAAVVLAVVFVASPFYLRAAIAAFESVDPRLLEASRTLGVGPGRTFLRVALPLAGPSGAGKTTLLRAIAGLLRPDRGRVEAGGAVWLDTSRGVDLPPERRSVGLVFQDYALFPHLTVEQNVAFGGRHRVPELLAGLALERLARPRPGQLSGREPQRVALARAP